MSTEKTLILVKPDGVQRGLIGAITSRLEARGLRIAAMKMLQISREMAMKHYGVHEGKPFFDGLVSSSRPARWSLWCWKGAARWR